MNFFKERLKQFAFPVVTIALMGLLLSIVFYLVLYWLTGYNLLEDQAKEKRLDGMTKVLGVSIAVTGFVSIIITIIQSRESIKRSLQESSIELFKVLRSDTFIVARRRSWIVKEKWYAEPGYKERLMDFNFSKRKKKLGKKEKSLDRDMNVVYQLMEFYLLVSTYKGSEDLIKEFRFFYYGWWRHFLYDFAHEVERRREISSELALEVKIRYLRDISYTATLERLDALCGFEHISRHIDIHKDGG